MSWEAYVHLAFDEIRMVGAGSPQVSRRLKAALDDLRSIAPLARVDVRDEQLELLVAATQRAMDDDHDVDTLANVRGHCPTGGEPRTRLSGASAEGWSLGRCHPVALQLLVQPGDRQRAPGHVETGYELAHLRLDQLRPGGSQQLRDVAEQRIQLLVLGCAKPIDQYGGPTDGVLRTLCKHRLHQPDRQILGVHPRR